MRPIYDNRPKWPLCLESKDISEVLIAGRWIRLEPGTFFEEEHRVVFRADGKIYETAPEHIQLRVAAHG